MPITVNLKENGTENTSRRFAYGSKVEVYGTVYGKILPSAFQFVRFEVLKGASALGYEESRTGLLGGYSFEFSAPTADNAYTIRISTTFPLGAVETKEVPIAFGSASPGDLPVVSQDESVFTSLDNVLKILPYVLALIALIYLINLTKGK